MVASSTSIIEFRTCNILRGFTISSSLDSCKPGNIPLISDDFPAPASPTIAISLSL
ncbi:MAG: hypothetical protein ACOX09_03265 [Candidatus Kapaibacterium sp.]